MERRGTFQELVESARQAGVHVRHAPLGGSGGGLACVRGRYSLFIDIEADPEEQLDRTVNALVGVAELQRLPLREDVRQLLSSAVVRKTA